MVVDQETPASQVKDSTSASPTKQPQAKQVPGASASSSLSFVPGPILILGAPGAGKGTQAQALMAQWHIPQISTGDLLRSNRAAHTSLGQSAEQAMDRGELVPDDLVQQMVAERLKQPDTQQGFVLDGFPRTLGQAKWLDRHLEQNSGQASVSSQVVAVNISVGYNELLRRITGRRTCPVCKRIYNVYQQPPRVEGHCDVDGTPLVARPDDTEEVFQQRMRAYASLTEPVIEHYRARGRFAEIDGTLPVDQVTTRTMDAIASLRR